MAHVAVLVVNGFFFPMGRLSLVTSQTISSLILLGEIILDM
jgi:hypothetical protein